MIRQLLRRMIERTEDRLGVPLEESRYLLEHSPGAFLAFSTVQTWSDRHKALPAAAYYVAKLAAYREEDCGTCLQVAVNLAKKSGVDLELVRAAAQGRGELLPRELREVFRFAQKQANRIDDDELRERLRARWGDEALIELGLAVAGARMFPAFKRTLGYARSCALVNASTTIVGETP
jgi:alkylhydroperoxidase family enzyme